jgi:hypothetical protein
VVVNSGAENPRISFSVNAPNLILNVDGTSLTDAAQITNEVITDNLMLARKKVFLKHLARLNSKRF